MLILEKGGRRMGKRFCLMLTVLLIVPAALAFFAFALPPQYAETFLGGYGDKIEALRSAPGRRIIFAGGSGAAFALRSDLLEAEIPGYSVVNLGMYAGLGGTVPLDAAKNELREGDIVIFLPEQSGQTLSLYFGAEAFWQAADGRLDLLRTVRPQNLRALLGQFPYFAGQKSAFFFQRNAPHGDGVYTRSAFNRWGDIDSDLRGVNTMPEGYDPNTPLDFSASLPGRDFIDYVNAYAAACWEKGADFYFAFCPMNEAASSIGNPEAYEQRLASLLECPLLGNVKDSLIDKAWFFDTNFHLNSAGAVVYTAQLAMQLKSVLGLPAEISFSLPEMPGEKTGEIFHGDDADAGAFLYRAINNGWQISGLSEAGAAHQTLTLPTVYQEKPVLGFDAAVFAGNRFIETVILQANLKSLPDGAFEGCDHLTALILQGVLPASCTVGQGLLRGTNAQIYVDADLLASYQTNYFWTVYAPRIHAFAQAEAEAPLSIQPQEQQPAPDTPCIRYDANDGSGRTVTAPVSETHLRTNTLPAQDAFSRPGYLQIGWNTQPDGSGDSIGLGSRTAAEPGMTLYAEWAKETPTEDFSWEIREDAAWITGFQGANAVCVIPSTINGFSVAGVCANAFRDCALDTVILPPAIVTLEPDAFAGCALRALYLFDTITTISDSSFAGCQHLQTLRLNAAIPPVYSISYYAAFADKYDWLLSLTGQKKLVLFSGSSTRYGYDSAALHRAYPSWQVANMGVYAYTNALPQMDLILQWMEPGDVLLHAPEFDTPDNQFCESNALDYHFWAMMEANYDCAASLDLRNYSRVFDSLRQYLAIRRDLPARQYTDSPNGYDDDGNKRAAATYNQYGDFSMPRDGCKIDVMLQHIRADYTTAPFTEERLAALNTVYQRYLEKGVQPLFTYTPRNRSSLTEDSTPANRAALARLLREQLCVPIITSLEDSLMSGTYFYLIDSHLSSEGVRLHTQRIVKALKPWLESNP